jgi:rhodanese-related sulfurtransferase
MFGRNKNTVDVKTAHEMATNEGWIIVDVRTKPERKEGGATGSIHYSLDSLNQRLPALRGKKVLAICRSGNRSGAAAKFLEQNGISAINVKGGMIAWERAGLPIKKGR